MSSMKWIVFVLCAGIVLAACSSQQVQVPSTQQISSAVAEALSPEVAQNIQNQISQLLGVPVESIQLDQVQKMDWPDGCLGLGEPGEACTQVVTPGWSLAFTINGQSYRFRANETGTIVRQEK